MKTDFDSLYEKFDELYITYDEKSFKRLYRVYE